MVACIRNNDSYSYGKSKCCFGQNVGRGQSVSIRLRLSGLFLHKSGELNATELSNVEEHHIKLILKESFHGVADEYISSLMSFEDEHGILSIQTMIYERTDTFEFRHPAVLPAGNPIVLRLVYRFHAQFNQVETQDLLSLLREKFWILRGRRSVCCGVQRCTICRRFADGNVNQGMSPLPEYRVGIAAAFEVIGVDIADRLKGLKHGYAVYRVVNLELVTSLSTEAFIRAVRSFIARRGHSAVICNDNGTNFVSTKNTFSTLDWKKIY
ncbi:hypothetical protein PR048_019930 [Dryococelus australis]|uniref:Integrase catalytic domain-containing protein n=1 Tax=Dryococelus australis TaxID=614101 RepID=A0ABQ9H4W4_9NEOP|nr:hypothetical protein PR048_019930 [Dryococelus australis]